MPFLKNFLVLFFVTFSSVEATSQSQSFNKITEACFEGRSSIQETLSILTSLGSYNGPLRGDFVTGDLTPAIKEALKSGKRLIHQYANTHEICFVEEELKWLRAMDKIQGSYGIECSKFNSVKEMEQLVLPLGKFIPPGGHVYLSREDQQIRMVKAIVGYENEVIKKLGKRFITVNDCKLDKAEIKFLPYNLAKLRKIWEVNPVKIPQSLETHEKKTLINSLEALETRMFSIYEKISFDLEQAGKLFRAGKSNQLQNIVGKEQKYSPWTVIQKRRIDVIYRDTATIGKALRVLKNLQPNSRISEEDQKVLSSAASFVTLAKNEPSKATSHSGVPVKISQVNSRAYQEGDFTNILSTMILDKGGERLRAFKINGHFNRQSNKFYVDDFCPDNVKKPCFNARYFTGVNYRNFEKHLTSLKEAELNTIAAKCFALTDMYDDFYEILKINTKNKLILDFYSDKRRSFVELGKVCRNKIKLEKSKRSISWIEFTDGSSEPTESLEKAKSKKKLQEQAARKADVDKARQLANQAERSRAKEKEQAARKADVDKARQLAKEAEERASKLQAKLKEQAARKADLDKARQLAKEAEERASKLQAKLEEQANKDKDEQEKLFAKLLEEQELRLVEEKKKIEELQKALAEKRLKEAEEKKKAELEAVERLRKKELEAEKKKIEELEKRLAELDSKNKEKVSSKSVDASNKLSEDWRPYANDMTLQQKQFCQLTDRFFDAMDKATKSGNEIKVNLVHKERQENFDGLLPGGNINNWIFKVVKIEQVEDGSAAVVLSLQCKSFIGSGQIYSSKRAWRSKDAKEWRATIPYNDRRFRELAKLDRGQYVLASGILLEIDAFKPGQIETFYASQSLGEHPLTKDLNLEGELFVADLNYIAALN